MQLSQGKAEWVYMEGKTTEKRLEEEAGQIWR
jgi:hypothetical protein